MRRVCAACALGVVLLLSACGGAPEIKVSPILPGPLRALIRSQTSAFYNGTVAEIDVYGPGSHSALVKASMGDIVRDQSKGFYLVVYHGHFVCSGCTGPHPLITKHGTIEVAVWSRPKGETDWAIMKTVLPTVKKLHRLTRITIS